jgi:hypothetical protein
MAQITFTDAVGAATLTNNFADPASRFANWTPMTRPFGDSVSRLSDGAITMFITRRDYGASFDLVGIPVKAQSGGTNLVAVADRLIAWLLSGGQCNVATGDSLGSDYPTCGLWPGTTPTLRMTNPKTLEYTLSLQVINLAVSPVRLDCVYA